MLVEAAWAASKAPGPLRAFFHRIRAKRGLQVAAVATARTLTIVAWQVLTKDEPDAHHRPSLLAIKRRTLELQAGCPLDAAARKGRRPRTASSTCVIASAPPLSLKRAPTRTASPNGRRARHHAVIAPAPDRGTRAPSTGHLRGPRLGGGPARRPCVLTRLDSQGEKSRL
jgi:hypothetical protein